MKFSLAILTALAAPLLVAASSQPSRLTRDVSHLNPDSEPVNLAELAAAEAHNEPTITNAERLRRGLKLNPPSLTSAAKRSGPSAGATSSRSGSLQIRGIDGDNILGFLGFEINKWGEYTITTNADKALHCSFSLGAGGSLFGITVSNNIFPSLPFLGAFMGPASQTSDLSSSSDYLFLGPSAQGLMEGGLSIISTAFGMAVGHNVATQTTMWTFDAVSKIFGVFWVDTLGNKVERTLVLVKDLNVIAMVADVNAFKSKFNVDCVAIRIVLA